MHYKSGLGNIGIAIEKWTLRKRQTDKSTPTVGQYGKGVHEGPVFSSRGFKHRCFVASVWKCSTEIGG